MDEAAIGEEDAMSKQPSRDGVFQRKDTAGWYASYVDSTGKRRKCRVQAHTRTQAASALDLIKAKVQRERVLGVRETSDMSTADLLAKFKREQKRHLAASSFERLEDILKTLGTYLPAKLKEITKQTVSDFLEDRSSKVAAGTVAKELTTLKHALRLAVDDWGLIQTNPARGAKAPKVAEGRTRYLSPTELKAVLEACPVWMRAPIALAAFTGMRRGEILKLRWRDVDLEGRRLYLHETKNGTLRVVPLNSTALAVLHSLPLGLPGALVLPDIDPARLSVYTRRVFASLQIEDASFHSLRHTAASWLVMEGADLFSVGKLLGHKTPRMTARYSHLSPAYLAEMTGKLDAAFERGEENLALEAGRPRD